MTPQGIRTASGVAAAGLFGAAMPLLISSGRAPLAALAAIALIGAFFAWPWAIVPVAVIGGTGAAEITGLSSVTAIVAVHGGIVSAGLVALLARQLLAPLPARTRTAADAPMSVLGALVAFGAVYGLAAGHPSHQVLVAVYEIGVVPLYYWLTTTTLGDTDFRRRAMCLYLVGAVAMAGAELVTPGRHGGLLSALALIPTLLAASRTVAAKPRIALHAAAALLAVDVALSAYRSVWLATGVAVGVVALTGSRQVRRTVAGAVILTVILGGATFAASSGARARLTVVEHELHASAGYRLPEATIGLHAFATSPLIGAGMGQRTPPIYIPGFRLENVGPVYHVFYVTVLANGGLLLVLALAAAVAPALGLLVLRRSPRTLPWIALLLGFLAAAAFAAPTDGHWELGLLPALALLDARSVARRSSQPGRLEAGPGAGR